MLEVFVEQADGDDLQCAGEGTDLSENVDAVLHVVNHRDVKYFDLREGAAIVAELEMGGMECTPEWHRCF